LSHRSISAFLIDIYGHFDCWASYCCHGIFVLTARRPIVTMAFSFWLLGVLLLPWHFCLTTGRLIVTWAFRLTVGRLIVTRAFSFECWASCLFLCAFYPVNKPFLHTELHVCVFPGERPFWQYSFTCLHLYWLDFQLSVAALPSWRILHFHLNSWFNLL